MKEMSTGQRAARIADGLVQVALSWEYIERLNSQELVISEIDAVNGVI